MLCGVATVTRRVMSKRVFIIAPLLQPTVSLDRLHFRHKGYSYEEPGTAKSFSTLACPYGRIDVCACRTPHFAASGVTTRLTMLANRTRSDLGNTATSFATSAADMFSVAPDIIATIAAAKLQLQIREVPLVDVERHWSTNGPSGTRLVFVT
jgi:hypothetical protein